MDSVGMFHLYLQCRMFVNFGTRNINKTEKRPVITSLHEAQVSVPTLCAKFCIWDEKSKYKKFSYAEDKTVM